MILSHARLPVPTRPRIFQRTVRVFSSWRSGKIIPQSRQGLTSGQSLPGQEYLKVATVRRHSRECCGVTFAKLSKQKQNRKAIESPRQYKAIYNQCIEKGCHIWKSLILRTHKTESSKEGAG